ncbi:unnamed protein product [Rhizophagus irregularis]|uniref:Uncharacterized protein n=1 Tax=Rhizophagus irregularis TaxID=588596 RepID=A0A915YZ58_9GLOM|nr:unnamed protein product [Rhizophagus irregularis]
MKIKCFNFNCDLIIFYTIYFATERLQKDISRCKILRKLKAHHGHNAINDPNILRELEAHRGHSLQS